MTTSTEPEFETLDPQVLGHLRAMNFSSVQEYRQWCVDHGFSRGLNKHASLRAAELAARQEKFWSDLKQRERESRNPMDTLLAICRGEVTEAEIQQPVLRFCARRIQKALESTTYPIDRVQFAEFIERLVAVRAKFVKSATDYGDMVHTDASWIDGLLNVCKYRSAWIRPFDSWRPRGHNVRRQFASMLRHLFAQYDDVPKFMDYAWLAMSVDSEAYREWFIHLGQGRNLRHCQLPLNYTKRMAHYFMNAPETLTVPEALRYGHVLGLGGDARLARVVLCTRLGSNFEHQLFWESVLRWFIQHPLLDRAQIGPIIDYIHYHKFATEEAIVSDATSEAISASIHQPNFSMRGRTPETLLRQVHRWHEGLANDNCIQLREWSTIGVPGLDFVEGQEDGQLAGDTTKSFKRWIIRELLSSQALIAEGRQLGHCVASYSQSCVRRQASIWTMEQITESGVSKLLTLEINPHTRTLVQARGRFNRMPKEQELKILQRWAGKAGLRIGC